MTNRRVIATMIGALALGATLMPSVAEADNTSCGNADYVFLNETAPYLTEADSSRYYKTYMTAGRSYAVLAWAPGQNTTLGGVDLSVQLFLDNACTSQAGGQVVADFEPLGELPGHTADLRSIVPTSSGTVYIRLRNHTSKMVSYGYEVHLLVVETTLFSPWWFTGGTNQAFVEVRNNMTASTTAVVTLYRANGTVCGTSSLVVAGNGNAALEVSGVGSCAGALSGSAQIAFGGSPEGLGGNITTISVPDGTSFDAPFTPRMSWGTFDSILSFGK